MNKPAILLLDNSTEFCTFNSLTRTHIVGVEYTDKRVLFMFDSKEQRILSIANPYNSDGYALEGCTQINRLDNAVRDWESWEALRELLKASYILHRVVSTYVFTSLEDAILWRVEK